MTDQNHTTTALVIAGVPIVQDINGLYSLNGVHRASKAKAPVYGKPWDHEKAYPLQAFGALLRAETTRPKHITLVQPTP